MESLSQPIEMEYDDMSQSYKELAMSFKVEEHRMYIRALQLKEEVVSLKVRANKSVGMLTDDTASLHNVITHIKSRYKRFNMFNRYSYFDITREIELLARVESLMKYINRCFGEIDEGCDYLIADTDEHLTIIYDDLLDSYMKFTYPSDEVDPDANHVLNEIIRLENIDPTFTEFKIDAYKLDHLDDFLELFPKEMPKKQKVYIWRNYLSSELPASARSVFRNLLDSDYVYTAEDCVITVNRTIKLLRNIIHTIWYKYGIFKKVEKDKNFEIKTDMQILTSILGKLNGVSKHIVGLNTCINTTKDKATEYYDFISMNYLNYYLKTLDQHIDVDDDF